MFMDWSQMKNYQTKQLVQTSLYIALVFIAAQVINIPTAIGGVINLVDAMILTIALLTTKQNAALIGATGSFLAEILSPYVIYAPATFVIKGLMGFMTNLSFNRLRFENETLRMLVSFALAETIMIVGYFIYQAFILNFGIIVAASDIVNNLIQAGASILIALVLSKILRLQPIKN